MRSLGVGVILLDFWSGIGEGSRGGGPGHGSGARETRSEEDHIRVVRVGAQDGRARSRGLTPRKHPRVDADESDLERDAPGLHPVAMISRNCSSFPRCRYALARSSHTRSVSTPACRRLEQVVDAVGEIVHLERDRLVRAGDGHVDGQAAT